MSKKMGKKGQTKRSDQRNGHGLHTITDKF